MSITIPHQKLAVYNDYGALNTTGSFMPFGPLANQHSSLIVGSSLFLGNKISTITISLIWDNLPADFLEYYAAYKQSDYNFDNQCFRISASILHKGNWVDLKVLTDNRLFKSDANDTLSKISSFSLQPENGIITIPNNKENESFKFTEKSSEGFFKIQLIAPQCGFGNNVYSAVLAEIITKNASGHNIPLPNPLYAPIAQSITVGFC